MNNLWLGLLLCSGLLWTTSAIVVAPVPGSNATYFLAFSNTVRAAATMKIMVKVANTYADTHLRLELMDYEGLRVQKGQNYVLKPSQGLHSIDFQFAEHLKRPIYYMYFLRAIGSGGGISFDQFRPLHWRNRQISVLIQTDKSVYKPGETVRFRALGLYPDMRVSDDEIHISVRDPLYNQIASFWKPGQPAKGEKGWKKKAPLVLSNSIQLPKNPRCGWYTVRASIPGGGKKKYFFVHDYDRPDFQVKIWVPKVDLSDRKVKVRIIAKYLIGSPIAGAGSIKVQATYYHLHYGHRPYILEQKFELNEKGEAVVFLEMSQIKQVICTSNSHYRWHCSHSHSLYYVSYRNVRFIATVQDHNSYRRVIRQKDIRLTSYRSYMKFINTEYRFKPALPYNVYIQDTRSNGKPVKKLFSTTTRLTVEYKVTNKSYCSYYSYYRNPYKTLVNQTLTFDKYTKVASLRIAQIPEKACFLRMRSSDGQRYSYRYVYPFYSPSQTFMHIEHNKPLDEGRKRRITVRSNKLFKTFYYSIFSRGDLVLNGTESKYAATKEASFGFEVTKDMVPVAHIIVFTVTDRREVVGDRLSLPVEYFPYDVQVKLAASGKGLTTKSVQPGKPLTMTVVSSVKGTEVYVLGRHLQMMTKYNDIKSEDITKALMAHDTSTRYFPYQYKVSDMFRYSGVSVVSNLNVPYNYYYYYLPRHYQYRRYWYYYYYRVYYYRCRRYRPTPGPPMRDMLMLKTPVVVPEYWLPNPVFWEDINMKKKTSVKRTLTAPDTITQINVTAFAVNRQHGLTLTKYPTQLNVTKTLFATMFLPKRAVRGEVICFNAIAHNTDSNKTHNVTMKLDKSSDYSVVTVTKDANGANKEDYSQASVSKELHLPVDGMKAVTFCVRFENIGDIKVRVAVKGVISKWDDVEKTINIKPEGIERSWSYPVLIELTGDKQTFQKTFDVTLPDKVIANSYTVTFSASGDVLGNAAANLGELLKRPYGSGAQNMIDMAPNVYVLTYLMATNRVGKLGPKARNIMQAGYNQQMVFQRYDGSFSAFGNWDRYGSTWLSAFVLKVFAQASTLAGYGLTVEPDMMQRAVGFVTEQQNMDGTFRETGAKIHKKLQGSTEENKLRLTAFTLIALIESGKFFMDPSMFVAANRVAEARTKSKVYLEGKMYKLTGQDPYSTCIATYALALAGSNKTDSAIERMKSIATTVGTDTMYWTVPGATQEEVVEMTGYGLLALMKKNDLASAIKVFRWLNQQQGRFGGFRSTQATVIALQALSRMTHLAMQSNAADVEVKVKVTKYQDDQVSQEAKVAIKAKTAVAVVSADSFKWPSQHRPGKVTVTASSSVPAGKRVFVMAQVTVDYSVHQVPSNGLYATFRITSYTAQSFYMQTCVGRYFTADHDPLYVAEYSIPTGFSISRKLSRYGMVSKAVMTKGKLITYHRGIYFVKHLLDKYKQYSCSYLRLAMNKGRVAHVRPPVVRVYNAENPKEEIAVGCTLPDSGVCDIVPTLCGK
ncbi:hypothetical protein ACOMHN_014379 [Nucella lapillus]